MSASLLLRGLLLASGLGMTGLTMAAPGEDTIQLQNPVEHLQLPMGNTTKPQPRTDLPAIAADIPNEPPANWPEFDYTKPSTDFQLQEGLRVVRSMAGLPAPAPVVPAAPAPKTPAKTDGAQHQ